MKEVLAAIAVFGGFASLWFSTNCTMQIDEPNRLKRHAIAAVIASIGAGLLAWLVSPADGATEMGWGWVLLALVVAAFLVALAAVSPAALEEIRAKHGLDKPQPLTEQQRKPSKVVSPKPNRTTRAIRSGWRIGEVEFVYEDAAGEITRRHITVHSIDSTYLKGECHDRQAERTFRLDRIIGDLVDCETGEILSPRQWARKAKA